MSARSFLSPWAGAYRPEIRVEDVSVPRRPP
jgi:hypothetical protein